MKRFSGTSNKGDFSEALRLAIQAAKDGLSTELVVWTLLVVSGENGGIRPQNDLTVEILAAAP